MVAAVKQRWHFTSKCPLLPHWPLINPQGLRSLDPLDKKQRACNYTAAGSYWDLSPPLSQFILIAGPHKSISTPSHFHSWDIWWFACDVSCLLAARMQQILAQICRKRRFERVVCPKMKYCHCLLPLMSFRTWMSFICGNVQHKRKIFWRLFSIHAMKVNGS